jgi:hypothetical protein
VGNGPDIKHDGNPDVITSSLNNVVSMRFGNGADGIGPVSAIPVGGRIRSSRAGDVNKNGNVDIIAFGHDNVDVITSGILDVSVFLANGSGQFTQLVVVKNVSQEGYFNAVIGGTEHGRA